MATTSLSFSAFRVVCAEARPKPRGRPKRKPPPKKPNSKSISTSASSNIQQSVLATTYTRLPLMDEDDDDLSSDMYRMEITLDDFSDMGKKPKKKPPPVKKNSPRTRRSGNASRFVQNILDEEDDDVVIGYILYRPVDVNVFWSLLEISSAEDEIFLDPGFDMKAETSSSQFEKEWEDEGEDNIEEGKEKGVPAVMRCFDTAKIYVKAGDGGNGVVAFRREKYVPYGGPDRH